MASTRGRDLDLTSAAHILVGKPADIQALKAAGHIRTVGPRMPHGYERAAVPVVYLTKRAIPWYCRRWVHITAITLGTLLFLAALVAWAILALGLIPFLMMVGLSATGITWAANRGGRRSVSVTTTTTTRVNVR